MPLITLSLVCWRGLDLGRGGGAKMLNKNPGPGCSKLMTSLVNDSLKFQTLIPDICQYFLLKKCAKASLIFFQQKYQCIW